MNEIKSWLLSICCATLACSLIEILFPTGKMKKSAKFVMSLFFIIAIVSPSISALSNFEIPALSQQDNTAKSEEYSQKVSELLIKKSEENLTRQIENCLNDNQVAYKKVEVKFSTKTNDDNNSVIDLEYANIYINNQASAENIGGLILSKLGIKTQLIIDNE